MSRRSAQVQWLAPAFRQFDREGGRARARLHAADAKLDRCHRQPRFSRWKSPRALAILGVHLSRIGEEIVLWSTQEFGFMSLSDAFSTSSSMMPQKKNPDVAELVRGKCARLMGCVTTLLVLEKSLCFGYGRDLQEDKRPIFDAFECALVSVHALTGAIATATFHAGRMKSALGSGHLCATDLADFLVQRGLPFRDAHHVVGALVREAETRGVQIGELPAAVLVARASVAHGSGARPCARPRSRGRTAIVDRRARQGSSASGDRRSALALAHESLSRTAGRRRHPCSRRPPAPALPSALAAGEPALSAVPLVRAGVEIAGWSVRVREQRRLYGVALDGWRVIPIGDQRGEVAPRRVPGPRRPRHVMLRRRIGISC